MALVMALVGSLLVGAGPASAEGLTPVVPPESIVLTGEPKVGRTLTVDPGTWTPEGTSWTYAWLADDAVIDGQTGPQLALGPDLVGRSVVARVTGAADGTDSVAKDSEPVTVAPGDLTLRPAPVVTGAARVGSPMTAQAGTWDEGVTLAYQWQADGQPVADATSAAFTPGPAQVGRVVTVQVTGTLAGYAPATSTSEPTSAVAPGSLDAAQPTVSGTGRVGEELVGQPGTWTPEPSFSYQWLVDGTPVDGATSTTFVPRSADVGRSVTFQVAGRVTGYEDATAVSLPVTVGAGTFSAAPAPTVNGAAQVGRLLTAVTGSWTPTPAFAYAWLADGVAVPGATAATFTPQAAQRGKRISVQVVSSLSGYPATSRTSAQTAAVAYGAFSAAPTPVISGTVRVGSPLKVAAGTWTPAPTLAYQWLVNGAVVTGATASSFTPQVAQLGKRITVKVTARRDGYTAVSRTSAPTGYVAVGAFTAAPTPRISGYAQIGWTLTAVPGAWSPAASLSYQWKANGVAIKGATATTYRPLSVDFGKRISVTVTARRTGYANGVRTSAATPAVTKPFTNAVTPTITGTVRVFSTVAARPGAWYPAPTFTYQWRRNGVAIAGATGSTYRLVEADYARRITVTVNARRTGYTPTSRTSAATAAVMTPAATLSTNGTYRVGTQIAPGTYWAPGGNGCYWERRTNSGTDFAGIIANDFSAGGRRIVTISSTDAYFSTDDCGSWTRLARIGTPAASFGAGMQAVGIHIQPGLYYAPGGSGCYWEGLSGFSGSFSDLIDNNYTDYEAQYVNIYSGVVGFDSHNCGTWTRVG